jgi:hypothetical protein
MVRELLLIAVVAASGCARCSRSESAAAGAPLASKPFYRLDAGPRTPCASGSVCEARLVLTALGDYHVNKEYPFKFIGDPAPAVPVDGNGTFGLDDAKHGTLTIKFRPPAAGTAKLAGQFKLSVCSDDTCEIETPKLELTVPVS